MTEIEKQILIEAKIRDLGSELDLMNELDQLFHRSIQTTASLNERTLLRARLKQVEEKSATLALDLVLYATAAREQKRLSLSPLKIPNDSNSRK